MKLNTFLAGLLFGMILILIQLASQKDAWSWQLILLIGVAFVVVYFLIWLDEVYFK